MTPKQKIKMLKDFILVQKARMSMMAFCSKWDVHYTDFTKIAYEIEITVNKEPKKYPIYECLGEGCGWKGALTMTILKKGKPTCPVCGTIVEKIK